MIKNICITLLFILLSHNAFAKVSVSIDRNKVALGETFTLTINVDNKNQIPNFDDLKDRFEIYNISSSQETNIINGNVSSKVSYIVLLRPKFEGLQDIPQISVGSEFTKPIQLFVTKANTNFPSTKNSNIFLETTLSSQNIYEGSPVILTIKLLYTSNIIDARMKPFDIPGIEINPLGKNKQYQATWTGKSYRVLEQNLILKANKPGQYEIPSLGIDAKTIANNAQAFLNMQGTKIVSVRSKPIKFEVKSIPEKIKSEYWFPANKVKLSDSWSSEPKLEVGVPITRTITVTAIGAESSNIPNINIKAPYDINVYKDKTLESNFISDGLPSATKTFKVAYIPTKAGKVKFPEIKLTWWDVKQEKVKSENISPRTLIVTTNSSSLTTNMISKPNNNLITTEDINSKPIDNVWFWVAIIFILLWLITLMILFISVYKLRLSSFINKSNSNKNMKSSPQYIQNIKTACKTGDIHYLNKSVINWAKYYFHSDIYTIDDIILHANIDDEFTLLIRDINRAIYSDGVFSDYDRFWEVICDFIKVNKKRKTERISKLKSFYPE